MAHHGIAPVGRNDGDLQVGSAGHLHLAGLLHGTRVERGDLVVVRVRDDDGLGRVVILDPGDQRRVHPPGADSFQVVAPVVANGGHDHGVAAQFAQVVGNVARAAAELPAQFGHEEGHVQDVQLFGQDLLAETSGKGRDGVKGEGAADQGGHGVSERRGRGPAASRPQG